MLSFQALMKGINMSSTFIEMMLKRRSVYHLGRNVSLPEASLARLIEAAVAHTPSAFNAQTARAVILFGSHNDRLWQIVHDTLQKIVPADKFAATAEKIASFAAGFGTVLFFEKTDDIEELQRKFPLYRQNFPMWAAQANGMTQFAVWCALAEAGIGASLQHYNPLIDEAVKKEWQIPSSWALSAQMPFGSVEATPGDKTFLPISERVLVKK